MGNGNLGYNLINGVKTSLITGRGPLCATVLGSLLGLSKKSARLEVWLRLFIRGCEQCRAVYLARNVEKLDKFFRGVYFTCLLRHDP